MPLVAANAVEHAAIYFDDFPVNARSVQSMGISGPYNGGTVPYKAIFCVDIPLHRPKTYALYMVGTSNQSVPESWPLIQGDFRICLEWFCRWAC